MWFFLAKSGWAERLLLNCLPDPFHTVLMKEWKAARYRLRNHRLKACAYPDGAREHSDKAFINQLINRSLGIFNSLLAVVIGIYCTQFDSHLVNNRAEGSSFVWMVLGSVIVGYFLWDLITVIHDFSFTLRSCQWLAHAVICLSALASPFFAVVCPMHYYTGALVLMEVSTPFLGFRWLSLKSLGLLFRDRGSEEDIRYVKHAAFMFSLLFVFSFFMSRIVLGPLYVFFPLMRFFFFSPLANTFHPLRWWTYVIAIPCFVVLNVVWMAEILHAAVVPSAAKTL